MDKIDWTPGEHGKGIVDQEGRVHAWNEDDYETHHEYVNDHPGAGSSKGYFYITPHGAIDVSHPSPGYDTEGYHMMTDYVCEADPHFHPGKIDSWSFG